MRNEIEYEILVRQPVELVLNQVATDASSFRIEEDELNRATLTWVLKRLKSAGPMPEWLVSDLTRLEEI